MFGKKFSSHFWRSPYMLLLVAVIAVAVYLIGWHTNLFRTQPTKHETANAYTKGQTGSSNSSKSSDNSGSSSTSASQSSSATQSGSQKSSAGGTSATLLAPTGDFVSNHHPNLSGSPAPNTLTSACNTTPGATCQITFTNDGVTKSLPAQTADSGGATYWNWKLQTVGLTEGSWSVQAIASLNGQTKTASDAMSLVVSQ